MRRPFRNPLARASARRTGFTLIELMVAVLIGFAVVGALLAAYMASYRSTLHNDALSQVTEDATLALNAIRAQAAMAGYSNATVDPVQQVLVKHSFPIVFGCAQSNFAGPPYAGIANAVPCSAVGTSTSDTLEVAYQANDSTYGGGSSNAILDPSGRPLDCLGNTFVKDPTSTYYLADSKFFVANGKLYCQGAGQTSFAAPLVDNVDQMTVRLGYSKSVSAYDPSSARVEAYVAPPPVGDSMWNQLVTVTVCVLVRSTSIAIEPSGNAVNPLANYVDCAGNPQQSPDGLLRRSFSTTVVFQNKLF